MTHDSTMFADDWFLGLWWAEWGPGVVPLMPEGGHWMLLIRNTTARDGAVQEVAGWMREEAVRAAGTSSEWRRTLLWSAGSAVDQFRFGSEQQMWIRELVRARAGTLHIGGGADVFADLLTRGAAVLPVWLSVLVAEQRPAGHKLPTP